MNFRKEYEKYLLKSKNPISYVLFLEKLKNKINKKLKKHKKCLN